MRVDDIFVRSADPDSTVNYPHGSATGAPRGTTYRVVRATDRPHRILVWEILPRGGGEQYRTVYVAELTQANGWKLSANGNGAKIGG